VPKPAKGENGLLDQIEARRRRVRELRANWHTIQSAPFPSSYCRQRAREQVEQLAMCGAISVSRLVEADGEIEFPEIQIASTIYNAQPGAIAYHQRIDVVGLIAFLHKPALIAALDRQIEDEADDGASLSHEDRQRRESEAQGDLLATEYVEAELVFRAQSAGLPVEHCADISPLALLGLRLVTAPRADALPTSPGHSWLLRR
jgi:hypothetical protein